MVSFEYTDALVLANFRHSLGIRNFLLLGLVYALFSGFVILICSIGGESLRSVAFAAVAIVALLGAVWYWYSYFQLRKLTLSSLAKLPHRRQHFTFTDNQVTVEGPTGESRLSWDMLQKLECFEDLWRLQFLNAQFLLPATFIDSELADFIQDKARQQKVEIYKNGFKMKGAGK